MIHTPRGRSLTTPRIWSDRDRAFPLIPRPATIRRVARTRQIRIGVSGWAYGHWRRGAFYPLAVALASSRVWLGVHYPSDVVAGAALGTVVGGVAS